MSKFEETMSAFGYVLEEQEGSKKLTYQKRTQFSFLVLVFDLELKYINPILVPSSVLLYDKDIVELYQDFKKLREDARLIAAMTNGKYKVLN